MNIIDVVASFKSFCRSAIIVVIPIITVVTPALFTVVTPLQAHEFWLEPVEFQSPSGQNVQVEIRNGQKFKGIELAYFDNRIVSFDWLQAGQRTPIKSRAGDAPAVDRAATSDGLAVLAYHSTPSVLTYQSWEKFTDFANHKGFPKAILRHHARGLPEVNFKETYTRFCKTLIGIGTAVGHDQHVGFESEILALANPYIDDLSGGFPVQVFYRGAPRPMAQVEVFERSPIGDLTVFMVKTDRDGSAMIPVRPQHDYLLDTVVLREPSLDISAQDGVVWQSLWSSMTFAVPK